MIPSRRLLKLDKVAAPVSTRTAFLLFALLLGVFVALRLWNLTAYSLWGGEVFTLYGVREGWGDLLTYIVEDIVHPPLFYVLLKAWIALGGESLLWLKLFPVLAAVATMAPFLLLCRELNLHPAEMYLAFLLIAVNGFLIHYAQELRMYSLFMFLSTCSYWLFVRFFNAEATRRLDLLALSGVNLLLVYTHYYGWLAIGAEFIFLLGSNRQKLPAFAFSIAVLLLCFSPWVYMVVLATIQKRGLGANLGWIPRPNRYSLDYLQRNLNGFLVFPGSKIFALLLFGGPVFLWGVRLVRADRGSSRGSGLVFGWLCLLSCFPVAVSFWFSRFLSKAVWVDRYFIFIAVPYMMLIAIATQQLRLKWLKAIVTYSMIAWAVLAGLQDLRSDRLAWEGAQLGSRIPWEDVVYQLTQTETIRTGDVKIYALTAESNGVKTGFWTIATSMQLQFDALGEKRFQVIRRDDMASLLADLAEDHFWVAFFESRLLRQYPPRQFLTDNGFQVGIGVQIGGFDNRLVLFPVWRL
jgi:hypothetical protein